MQFTEVVWIVNVGLPFPAKGNEKPEAESLFKQESRLLGGNEGMGSTSVLKFSLLYNLFFNQTGIEHKKRCHTTFRYRQFEKEKVLENSIVFTEDVHLLFKTWFKCLNAAKIDWTVSGIGTERRTAKQNALETNDDKHAMHDFSKAWYRYGRWGVTLSRGRVKMWALYLGH